MKEQGLFDKWSESRVKLLVMLKNRVRKDKVGALKILKNVTDEISNGII